MFELEIKRQLGRVVTTSGSRWPSAFRDAISLSYTYKSQDTPSPIQNRSCELHQDSDSVTMCTGEIQQQLTEEKLEGIVNVDLKATLAPLARKLSAYVFTVYCPTSA